jgi:hypothetical protein
MSLLMAANGIERTSRDVRSLLDVKRTYFGFR